MCAGSLFRLFVGHVRALYATLVFNRLRSCPSPRLLRRMVLQRSLGVLGRRFLFVRRT
jgi:hypothetical protein